MKVGQRLKHINESLQHRYLKIHKEPIILNLKRWQHYDADSDQITLSERLCT